MYRWCVGLFVSLFMWSGYTGQATAAGDPFERASLAGITTLQVVVEDLNPSIVQDGLDRVEIKDYVTQQLEQAGIVVEPQAEHAFYVHINAVKNPLDWYSYSISFQLLQMVFLFRDPGMLTWGTTWSLNETGSLPVDRVNELETDISRGVTMFLTDYRAANSALWEESSYWLN